MTILWVVFWWVEDCPKVKMFNRWNGWGIGLLVCIVIDIFNIATHGSYF